MKKVSFLLCLVFYMINSYAQIQFGLKAGYNLSSLINSGTNFNSNQKSKSGFNAGVFGSIPLFKSFVLQPEIYYSEQGSQSQDSSAKTNYNYLNIPLLFKYQHSSGIFIETGPQLGFLLNSNYKSGTYTQDLKSVSNSADFSWIIGAGYKILPLSLGLDIRYNYGITNVTTYKIIT